MAVLATLHQILNKFGTHPECLSYDDVKQQDIAKVVASIGARDSSWLTAYSKAYALME